MRSLKASEMASEGVSPSTVVALPVSVAIVPLRCHSAILAACYLPHGHGVTVVQTPVPESLFNTVSVDRSDRFDLTLWNLPDVRNNLLALWSPKSYRARSLSFKLLNQPYFVCNSPDTVRRVFLDRHDNYDKKSPQMRHALAPLLGDGLFVNDGELWKKRRAACSPPFEREFLPGFGEIMSASATAMAQSWSQKPDGPRSTCLTRWHA
jgi:hypothetical protein